MTRAADPAARSRGAVLAARVIGALGVLTGVLLIPPLFAAVLSLEPGSAGGGAVAWLVSAGMLLAGGVTLALARRIPARLPMLLLGLLLVLDAELVTRLVLLHLASQQTRFDLQEQLRGAQRKQQRYRGHPFVQFTGAPGVGPYNSLGFHGSEFTYRKPAGVVRVACLGGSTTASGYPDQLGRYLNKAPATRAEVLNFGMEGWNSAHTVANFVLNVRDFAPDYVVIHQGWNDNGFCRGACVRGDYSHALRTRCRRQPGGIDALLARSSAIYLWIKLSLHEPPVTSRDQRPASGEASCANRRCQKTPMWQYRRNLQTILTLARASGVTVVLTTQPHSTDPTVRKARMVPHFKAANSIIRALHRDGGGRTLLVDLDRTMTGKLNQRFTDVGHLDTAGRAVKARRIGEAILAHLRGQEQRTKNKEQRTGNEGP